MHVNLHSWIFFKRNSDFWLFFYLWLPFVLTIISYFGLPRASGLLASGYILAFAITLPPVIQGLLNGIVSKISLLFFSYIIVILISILVAGGTPLISTWYLGAYILLPYLLAIHSREKWRPQTVYFNITLLGAAIIFVLIENLADGKLEQRAKVFGNPANSIQFSIVSAFVISFALGLFKFRNGNSKFAYFGIFIIGLAMGVLAPRWLLLGSLFLLLTCCLLGNAFSGQRRAILCLIAGWCLTLTAIQQRADFYIEQIISGGNFIGSTVIAQQDAEPNQIAAKTSTEERVNLIAKATILAIKNPIYGVGAGNFGVKSGGVTTSFPHMSPLHVSSELGAAAFVLYLALVLASFLRLFFAASGDITYFPWLAIMIFGVTFSLFHGNYLTDKLIYIAIGCAAAIPAKENFRTR